MGLLDTKPDPRLVPGGYLHDGTRLIEVADINGNRVTLLNCRNDVRTSTTVADVLRSFQLVRPAPAPPDTPELDASSRG